MLNMNGEVVGINSAKLASTEVEGMGYAIAISDVADILQNLMNETPRDKVENGSHGVLNIKGTTVSEEAVQVYGIPEGVFVAEVTEGGAAENAGIKENMVITNFDGKRVRSIESLVELLEYYEPGEEIDVTVEVMDGEGYKEKTVTVTLGENTDTEENSKDEEEQKDSSKESGDKESQDDEESDEDSGSIFEDWERDKEDVPDIQEFFRQWQ